MKASPYKLRSGEWGARVYGAPQEGQTILITAKSGKSWNARVKTVLWKDQKASLVALEPRESRRRSGSSCHTDGNCSSLCPMSSACPCYHGGWFDCC